MTLQYNDVSDSRQHGVHVHRGATAFVRHNHLHGNGLNELKIDEAPGGPPRPGSGATGPSQTPPRRGRGLRGLS